MRTALRPTRIVRLAATLAALGLVSLGGAAKNASVAAVGWQWYKTDTHVHSVTGGDGFDDYGILANAARARGYDALFLTDHQGASSFPIGSWTANTLVFEDTYSKWSSEIDGTLSSTTNALASTPVNSGTRSLHLASSSNGSGETFVVSDRGPNFRSGDITITFSVYPTRIDAGSGAYVSVSIGGDRTVTAPDGYTTADGVVSPGKSTILVWQLGSARTPSTDPNARVLTYPLSYTLNRWNTYTINVSQALLDIPAADRPLDYNAVTQLKMSAAANNGTVNAYFDTYSIRPSNPVPAADEFTYRHSVIHSFDTATFKIFESEEMGVLRHSQRFNFAITDPSQYGPEYQNGVDGIPPTQQSGYPAQLNHPGLPGGVSQQEAINNLGYNADFMEAREDAGLLVMIDTWDSILSGGVQLIGTWSSDMHHVSTLDVSYRGLATNVYAPSLTFDELLHSLFEGRAYVARNNFTGRLFFNLDSSSSEPYPARYPVYVPNTQTSANVHLSIPAGLSSGNTVTWIVNGAPVATETVSGSTYESTRSVTLSGAFTYVRAEVKDSSGSRRAMTEPIFFRDVNGLPAGDSYHVDRIETANGRDYTKIFVKGVTSSSWNAPGQSLSLTLDDPAGSLVTLLMDTPTAPQRLKVDGASIAPAASLADFDAASGSSWYYDAAAGVLHFKALHAAMTATVLVEFSTVSDTQPPTIPSGLTATPVSSTRIDLSWTASTDNIGVTGYEVFRNGVKIGMAGTQPSYSDTTAATGTTYQYQVRATDAAGNVSGFSNTATATTPVDRLFYDGFETGDMSRWSSSNGLVVQNQHVFSGSYAARGTTTAGVTFARATLSTAQSQLYYRIHFKIISQAANTVYLLRFRTAADAAIIGPYVSSGGILGYRNDVTGATTSGSVAVSHGVWHDVQMRVRINGTASETEVWFDGARVAALSKTESLGTNPIGRIQLGDHIAGATYDFAFDEVAADTVFITDGGADTTPPDTTITSGPPNVTNSTAASFAFSASESGSTFACSLDGGAFTACSSPKSYSGLAGGGHTFSVRATDAAGNTDPTPAAQAWTIDTAAPSITATTPSDSATDVDVAATVTATFNEQMNPSTVNGTTFTLVRQGDTTPVPATVTYDGVTQKAILDPTADLQSLTTYVATVKGGFEGVLDLAGNGLAADRTWTFTTRFVIDTTPPDTTITSGPAGVVASTSATFAFSSTEAGSSFACSLDGSTSVACTSPQTYAGLAEGSHTFAVSATDAAGNTDPTPATRTWTIDSSLFSDGFESGDFSRWSSVRSGGSGAATVQSTTVSSGAFSARLSSTSEPASFASARASFASSQTDVTVSGDFQVAAEGASGGNVPLFRLFDAPGARIISLHRLNQNGDKVEVAYGGTTQQTSGSFPLGSWHHVELHVVTAGTGASTIEVRIDGALVLGTTSASLGTAGVRDLQIGNDTKKQGFTVFADDVSAHT